MWIVVNTKPYRAAHGELAEDEEVDEARDGALPWLT